MLYHRKALGLVLGVLLAAPASAQYIDGSPPPLPDAPVGPESSADALARNVRILAQSPRDYNALVGAGRAALATGDAEAAIGFFGRAADVWPAAAAPKSGMAAALVAMGEPAQALPMFTQAQRAGAPVSSFALDRGLARDLLGQQSLAQSDYRLALYGPDGPEARRRLALSQAISGDRSGALATLSALRSDPATIRTRAFVLALGGDADSADRALDAAMPGMSNRLDPFFRRLSALSPAQKAAAVHLGIIPGTGTGTDQVAAGPPSFQPIYPAPQATIRNSPAPATAYRAPPPSYAPPYPAAIPPSVTSPPADRLAGIDALLRGDAPSEPVPGTAPAAQLATASPPSRSSLVTAPAAAAPRRFWVQLASGTDAGALGAQFRRIVAREPDLFKGIRPYVAEVDGRTKLLIGPFHDTGDSTTFVENLADAHIDGFGWTSPEGQPVRKLDTP